MKLAFGAIALLLGTDFIWATKTQTKQNIWQVAVIGAGAGGSSTAYHLQQYAQQAGLNVNITVFEKSDRIGGRTLTINPYDDLSQRIELGASIFIEKNYILYNALKEFNLSKRAPDEDSSSVLGIWDGEQFVFSFNEDSSYWWNALKVIWKYGIMAPRRTENLMISTIDKFLRLYQEPYFPFRSLTQRAYELDLHKATGVTGEQWLKNHNIDDLYAHDIVQAATRVNYASNLGRIHGLDTMVSMAPAGAMAVEGGNWQIFDKMVQLSGAAVALNTSVTSLKYWRDEALAKYDLKTRSAGKNSNKTELYPVKFDSVIIASPWQFAGISADNDAIQTPIDTIPYVQLHVTIFASPFSYSPAFFGLKDAKDLPGTILTTLAKGEDHNSGSDGAGKAGFFSISILRKTVNPKTLQPEYIYKIFSPEKVTPEFLSRLFGLKVPDGIIDAPEDDKENVSPISWYYPHVFNSYPKALPRVTFQDPIVGPWLFYTSGMDSFISTMETNALMGKNVARLLVDSILALPNYALAGEEKQKILGRLDHDKEDVSKEMEDL
ncbi:putative prenylcysteine oxidase [Podospora fimiseda]|uniref:Prenylcysteine oxidase n=1 Tax=Podospora fimiseda TaxID=252190 RepID=A0AAN7BGX3_9PEZI|nr:putative prenylcysteine oxidase [Podospora fimiseda]